MQCTSISSYDYGVSQKYLVSSEHINLTRKNNYECI